MIRNVSFLFAAVLIVSLALFGCQRQSPPPPASAPEPAPAPAPAPAAQQAPTAQPAPPPPAASGEPNQEVKAHLKQGMSYVSVAKSSPHNFHENIANAINEFSNAITKDPSYAEAYSNRAVAYMMQRKYNKALDDLKKAKELKPDSASIRYNLASVHSLMGNTDYGMDELDAALEKGFNDYESLRRDPDIDNLRKHKEFRRILEKHKVFIRIHH
jgi:tetratricopeptide (TPR) repeat protein